MFIKSLPRIPLHLHVSQQQKNIKTKFCFYPQKRLSLKMVSVKYSSESDSSDDDNLALLREAADPDLINDSMFQLTGEKTDDRATGTISKPFTVHKSQRYIADDDKHIDDLLIPEEVQKFVSKKLAKIIDSRVEFVDIRSDEHSHANIRCENVQEEINLLEDVVLKIDWASDGTTQHSSKAKAEIKKRKLPDVDNNKTERVRFSEAVIDLEDVSKEVSNWKTKPKRNAFEYIEKNGKLFEVEPMNEFSVMRRKNNWDESKISRNKSWLK